MVGRGGEVELLARRCHAVITRTLQAQCALKVQKLTHEVEVGRDVGFFHLDDVVRIVHGQVELLHQIRHCHRDRAADACKAVDQNTALLSPSFIWWRKKRVENFISHFYKYTV